MPLKVNIVPSFNPLSLILHRTIAFESKNRDVFETKHQCKRLTKKLICQLSRAQKQVLNFDSYLHTNTICPMF